MLNEAGKLKSFGIDLRSRSRRRFAVVVTFGLYVLAMLVVSVGADHSLTLQRYHLGIWLMFGLTALFSLGIFREGGPVKAFAEPVWRVRGMKGGLVMVRSLDDLAEYRFGGRFDALTEAEQDVVLRAYRVGNYLFPAENSRASTRLDERERIEKDRAYGATLAKLTRYLFYLAGFFAIRRTAASPAEVVALMLTLGYFAVNGPKALILWDEPAPWGDGGLVLVRESREGGTP
jgi:hypothetical protein